MLTNGQTEARKLHSRLKHPVIDADGHWAEYAPLMREEFRRIGGDTAVEALAMASARIPNSLAMSVAERQRRRIGQEAFWFLPTKNTLDRATAMLPRLLYERLDDLGLDFCVIYPTAGLAYFRLPNERLRRALCRAYNTGDDFRDFMFTNAVRFWGEVNPDFFKGTVVEKQAAEVLAQPAARA